jgi:23S rRNA pseudouridine1911/1915/1917 synthase
LDTGTSGLVIVARTRAAYERWREHFKKKEVSKKYLAWCWTGKVEPEPTFEIALAIAHAAGNPGRMVCPATGARYSPPVMEAQTLVKVRARDKNRWCFLAEVSCYSGVTHQVRVHLASKGHPLLGDATYDPRHASRAFRGSHHLLRAVNLESPEGSWKAGTEEFQAIEAVFPLPG